MQTYLKCIEYFYKGFDSELHLSYRKDEIPFEEGMLNSIVTVSYTHLDVYKRQVPTLCRKENSGAAGRTDGGKGQKGKRG